MDLRSYKEVEMADHENLFNEVDQIGNKNNLKDYHAFVYWFIENSWIIEKQTILNSICDGAHDKGIDAVIIDDVERKVTIIQSKFERAGNKVQIKESDIKLFAAIKNYFDTREALDAAIKNGNEVVKRLLTNAFEAIHKKNYFLNLFFITTHKKAPHLNKLLHDTYDFRQDEFFIYDYQEIMQLYSEWLRDQTPRLGTYNLPYKDEDKNIIRTSTCKSWVLTVPLDEIRCIVSNYGDRLFMKNVRNFLGDNRCNKGIQDTLKSNPDNFWYYNNGISVLCDDANIVVESKYIHLINPQIVNGCQTARSIEKFRGDLKGDVMVRVIASKDHEFIDRITFYQNSLNPVKKRDLKSNDPVQVRLRREFRLQGWYYEVKRGESFKDMVKKYPAMKQQYKGEYHHNRVINNEEVAQILAVIKINPAAYSEGSEKFFDDYYADLFHSQISTFNCLAPNIIYWMIVDTYKGTKNSFYGFKKAYSFKNPAAFYVLRFIYESINNKDFFEKKLLSFYESADDKTYDAFEKSMSSIISKYFEVIHKAWKASKEESHTTYLKNSTTIENVKKRYSKETKKLKAQTKKIFTKYESS